MIFFKDKKNIVLYCPHCKAKTGNTMFKADTNYESDVTEEFYFARCSVCGKKTLYVQKSKKVETGRTPDGRMGFVRDKLLDQKIIYPVQVINPKIPQASEYMPDDVKALYNEASSVFDLSPRSSGALIRITLERLIKRHVLTDNTGRLNDMIGRLSTTFPDYILKLMDNIRNTGNQNAHDDIHEIKDEEDKNKIIKLFEFINWICGLIKLNKESDEMFDALPEQKRQAIKRRNQKTRDSE